MIVAPVGSTVTCIRIAETVAVAESGHGRLQRNTERTGHRDRARGIRRHVRTARRQRHAARTPRRVDRETRAGEFVEGEVDHPHVARPAVGQHVRSGVRGHRHHAFVVGVEHGGPRRRQRLDELALGDRHAVDPADPFGVGIDRRSVTTPMSGRATSHSRVISPNPRIPISNTSTSVSSGALRIVTGRPCSLLKLRSFAVVRRVAAHAAAMRSFVDVLPTLPVTPDDAGGRSAARPAGERHQGVRRVGDLDRGAVDRRRRPAALVRNATAPAASAWPMKSWPSRSATIGTNSCPGRVDRESNDAPSNSTSGPTSRPPTAAAASDARILTRSNGTVRPMDHDGIAAR